MKRATCCAYVPTAFPTALTTNPKMLMSSCLEQGGSVYLLTPPTHKRGSLCCNCRIFYTTRKTSVSLTTQHQNQTVINFSKGKKSAKTACLLYLLYWNIPDQFCCSVCCSPPILLWLKYISNFC